MHQLLLLLTLTGGTNDWSYSTWFKSTSANPADTEYIMQSYTNPDFIGIKADTDGSITMHVSDDATSTFDTVTTSGDVYDTNWHQFIGQRNGSTFEIYVDGRKAGSTAVSNANLGIDPANIYIGSHHGLTPFFTGSIDESRIDSVARTADEIRQAFEIGKRTHQITNDFVTTPQATYSQGHLSRLIIPMAQPILLTL